MSAVDWSQMTTLETRAAAERGARRLAVNAECQRRIFAVASANAQRNMGVALGLVAATPEASRTNEQAEILAGCAAALAWVQAMRGAAADHREGSEDFSIDEAWPAPPEGVEAMLSLI